MIWVVGVALGAEPAISWQITRYPFAGGERRVGRASLDGRQVYGVHRVEGPGWVRGETPKIPADSTWSATVSANDVAARLRAYGSGHEPRVHEGWLARPMSEGPAELAPVWVVDLLVEGPATWRVWVDSRTGQALRADKTSREARGDIYPISPILSELQRVELPRLVSETELWGEHTYTSSCSVLYAGVECVSSSSQAMPDLSGDYLFSQDPGSLRDPAAEVHAYYHIDKMSAWLIERFDLRLPYTPIQAITNFEVSNAFFGDFDLDGLPEVSFGQSGDLDYAYDADVVYHELGHAVVNELAPDLPYLRADEYGLEWAPSAVDEGAADVFAMVLTGDPRIADYAGQYSRVGAFRDLARPRRCPDDLQGEVHVDGEILGSLGWHLISEPLVGPDLVAEWLVGAIPLWGPETDWPLVGESLQLSADDLLAAGAMSPEAHELVRQALEQWNLPQCGRVVTIEPDVTYQRWLLSAGLVGDLVRLPAGTQVALEVPEDVVAVRLYVSDFYGAPGLGYSLLGRQGEPVLHEWSSIDAVGLSFSTPTTFDWQRRKLGDITEIELKRGGDPPLVSGETLYLALASENLGELEPFQLTFGQIEFWVELVRAPRVPPPQAQAERGCACGGAYPADGVWMVVAGLWLRRRSRWS